jgi:hypothetical protein
MGDTFKDINNANIATHGSTIATNGAIAAAHEAIIEHASTLNNNGQEDVAKALKDLESLITAASDSELALEGRVESLELLKQVADEATKSAPNKTALKVLGQGFLDAIKSAPAILTGVQKLWPIVSSLWI